MGRRNGKQRADVRPDVWRRLPSKWARIGADSGAVTQAPPSEKPPIYVRACPDCGHMTASLDPRLLNRHLECPDCQASTAVPSGPNPKL